MLRAGRRLAEARRQIEAARSRFEALPDRHLLASADHGAEFYAGSGGDAARALALARVNLDNRPTLRAFEQADEAAVAGGAVDAAADLPTRAAKRWDLAPASRTPSFRTESGQGRAE
ncbi:hypothetical protein [Methylobacterium nigriterrae]|uniref:hypothetical protein n=1 Tax=Methylobacterium nigriterrae TaxID=3127512 RepID=UPI0030132E3B